MSLKWDPGANGRKRDLVRAFQENLTDVAQCFAGHEQAASVSTRHVDEAFTGIARLGLTQRPFLDRPESYITVGSGMAGFSFAIPDGVGALFSGNAPPGVASGGMIACFAIGLILAAMGIHRARIPTANQVAVTKMTWFRRVVVIAAGLFVVSAAVFSAVAFSESCRVPTVAPSTTPMPDVISTPGPSPTPAKPTASRNQSGSAKFVTPPSGQPQYPPGTR